MIAEIGLGLISAGWIFQAVKMKKDELNKYALMLYILGVAILAINGAMDGVSIADMLEILAVVTSLIVLVKLMKKK
ncbi:MAG TPA: hypothetical protein VI790_00555 [Candidatus Nanoarchaeia archaeon]|nr:hypothetical protein [Candidatus Nanoarchaeia archaeon]